MSRVVLLVSKDASVVSKTTAVLESLEHVACHLTGPDCLPAYINRPDTLMALVALENSEQEARAVATIRSETPGLPVYLMRQNQQIFGESGTTTQVDGTLSLPVRFPDLMEILRKARVCHSRNSGDSERGITITGESQKISSIKRLIRQVAPTDASVLISGESGTGKEVVARNIHNLSLRSSRPFVAVNCGAIPPELLESELFGHEKGAFTGAFQSRAGRFELAEGGTLFLDEIGDMPLNMQVKLLRVIQERTFERVGGTSTHTCDVRLIAATHQDLEQRIDDGAFRMDLFYRLNVFPIELPPLRERREDIPLLINEFIRHKGLSADQRIGLDNTAMAMLMNHRLPGNVRELQNLVERLSILHPGESITPEKLPKRYRAQNHAATGERGLLQQRLPAELLGTNGHGAQKINLKQYLASLEKNLICRALEQSDWVVTQAARTLSVQRTTLIEKIRKLEIRPPEAEDSRQAL